MGCEKETGALVGGECRMIESGSVKFVGCGSLRTVLSEEC
jgi:hypothetical protein